MHGEYVNDHRAVYWMQGSPPYAWGILHFHVYVPFAIRITPICMGNTCLVEVHKFLGLGSPPYAWGILKGNYRRVNNVRITPICMGNTVNLHKQNQLKKDHPHMHGEYLLVKVNLNILKGSPPYAWGILNYQQNHRLKNRITPICMGNTL